MNYNALLCEIVAQVKSCPTQDENYWPSPIRTGRIFAIDYVPETHTLLAVNVTGPEGPAKVMLVHPDTGIICVLGQHSAISVKLEAIVYIHANLLQSWELRPRCNIMNNGKNPTTYELLYYMT